MIWNAFELLIDQDMDRAIEVVLNPSQPHVLKNAVRKVRELDTSKSTVVIEDLIQSAKQVAIEKNFSIY